MGIPNAPIVGLITQPTCTTSTGSVVLTGLPNINWTITPGNITGNTTSLSWTVATDDIGVTSYDVYKDAILLMNTTATNLNVTGLSPSTAYSFIVKAKDAAGNQSVASNTVIVNTLSQDLLPPTPPTLSASGTTSTTTQLSWSGATDNYGVTGYDVYQGAVLLGSTSLTTFPVASLSAFTSYSFSVKAKDAANNISASSNIVNVTTLAGNYCSSQGNSVVDELIGNVQFGTINNTSTGGTGYTNFTSISTEVTLGTTQTISITPTWTGTIYNEGYAVFIDYNRDGDFDDSGETVYTRAASTLTPVTGTFTIPLTATPGSTRMRVSLKYNGIPTACETYSFGQVEDYTVLLKAVPTETVLNLKLFIEGYYDTVTHTMTPVKANQGIGTSTTDVDDIIVELHNVTTFALVASTNAILKTDGTVNCTFTSNYSGSYYIAVKHRSAVQTWSNTPVLFSTTTTSYDFSNAINKAYGNNLTEVETGIWAFYNGDLNQDFLVDTQDYTSWESDYINNVFGYSTTDLNGDGLVDTQDYTIWESNYLSSIFSATP